MLINTGSERATYRESFISMRMTETCEMEEIDPTEEEPRAEPFVRYSPRQVTLEPQVAQVVGCSFASPPTCRPVNTGRICCSGLFPQCPQIQQVLNHSERLPQSRLH